VVRPRLCETRKIHKPDVAAWRFFNRLRQKKLQICDKFAASPVPAGPRWIIGEKSATK
jgi:hypothetical protein